MMKLKFRGVKGLVYNFMIDFRYGNVNYKLGMKVRRLVYIVIFKVGFRKILDI